MSAAMGGVGLRPGPAASSKLRAPQLQHHLLDRERILDQVTIAAPRVVTIEAAAGFGKTIVARQFTQADARPAAWLALDEGDDDPVVFMRMLVQALHRATPLPDAMAAVLQQPPAIDAGVMPALDAGLQRSDGVVLVLDDVHRLSGPASLRLLDRVVDLMPPTSTIVLCSRAGLPIRLARRRLSDDLLELRMADLAFTDEEAQQVLARGLPWVTTEVVDALVEQAEGWPAGLQLTVLALKTTAEPPDATSILVATQSATTEYVRQELLAALPAEDRSFLVRTAVVESPSGPMCDFMLETSGSGDRLSHLAASGNLFVTTLDADQSRYRYHHVFQQLLLAELRSHGATHEAVLRSRAAHWLADNGELDQAVDQAIQSGDAVLAGQMILRSIHPCVIDGRLATLHRWLSRFDPSTVRGDVRLTLAAGMLAASTSSYDEVPRWYSLLESHPLDELSTSERWVRDALILLGGHLGIDRSYDAACRLAEARSPENEWRAWGLQQAAVIGHHLGRVDDPRPGLLEAEFLGRNQPAVNLSTSAQLALFDLLRGDRAGGQERALSTWTELTDRHLDSHPLLPVVHVVAGLALAQQGRPEWRDRVASGLALFRATADGPLRALVQLRLVAAEAALSGGDHALGAELVGEVPPFLDRIPSAVNLKAWSADLAGRLTSNPRVPAGGSALSPAERSVLELLATHLTLPEVAEHLFVSRNTVKSHTASIYRKLGVSSRSAAVAQARALGFLPPPTAPEATHKS